jgi:plastocyanin
VIRGGAALLTALALQGGHGPMPGPGLGPTPAAERGAGPAVSIGFDAYAPPRVDVLVGDAVHWTNVSVRAHTVSADDGTWDSPRIEQDGSYERRFDAEGSAPYFCRLHVGMRGEVAAHTLLLGAPVHAAGPGLAFPLEGRAALASGSTVTVEADPGTGFAPAGTATVGADGSFAASVTPTTTATYRAVAGDAVSPEVLLVVLDRRVAATATAAAGRRGTVVAAEVAPASPGATVVVQLRLRERFGWWPVRRARLDAASRATFAPVRPRRRVPARVVLTLPDGATQLAVSPTFRVGAARGS